MVAALLALWAGGDGVASAQQTMPVVASFSVLADLVREVGGERITVRTLVGPDGDAHVYQPTPLDARDLNRAKVLVVNGLGLEGWIERLVQSSGFKGEQVIASNGVTLLTIRIADDQARGVRTKAVPDPHAWQAATNGAIYVDNIARGLSQADPAGAAYYAARANAYKQQLAELDSWIKSELAAVPPSKRRVITTHGAFGYFGAAYGVTFVAAAGLSTDGDPSARHIAALIAQVRNEHIRALFIENMTDPRLIEQIARDGGATLGGALYSDALSAPGGPADTYLKMFRHNVSQLKAGMLNN